MTSADGALWVQRTANPGAASDFSPWTRLDTAATACNVAVCSHGASVLVFFRDPSDARVVRVRESADSGATWAARRTAATLASGAVDWLATSFSSAGAPALFLAAERRSPARDNAHRRDVERPRCPRLRPSGHNRSSRATPTPHGGSPSPAATPRAATASGAPRTTARGPPSSRSPAPTPAPA